MLHRPQSRAVGVASLGGISDQRSLVPAVPEVTDPGDPFLGAVVGRVMVERAVGAEMPGAAGIGDDVESEAVSAEVLQRGELARRRVGQVRSRVDGWRDPDVRGRVEQVGREQQRIELGTPERLPDAQVERRGVTHRWRVLDDQQVEARLLELAHRLLVQAGLCPAIVPVQVRVTPALRSEAAGQEPAEVLGPTHSAPAGTAEATGSARTAARPRARSTRRSSRSSMPIDTRSVPGQMPDCSSSSVVR